MTLRGIIFDFDGLILDTESPEFQAWQEIYHNQGVELDINIWARCIGASMAAFDPVAHLENLTHKHFSSSDLVQEHRKRSNELANNLVPLPGVINLIKTARESGIKTAIASSSDRPWVISRLKQIQLMESFDCIRTSTEVNRVKPNPDLYQAALKCLELTPQEAVAFEDSPNGVTAAISAGLFCIAVPNPVTRLLPIQHASLVIDSMDAITLDDIRQYV